MSNASYDFLAGITVGPLNNAIVQVFPQITNSLSGGYSSEGLTIEWQIEKYPTFNIPGSDNGTFTVEAPLKVKAIQGHTPSTAGATLTIECQISVNGSGVVSFSANDVKTFSTDRLLQIILSTQKPQILSAIQNILDCVQIPVGPIEGISFSSYKATVSYWTLLVGAGLPGTELSLPDPSPFSGGFGVVMSKNLLAQFVNNNWWANQPRSYRPNKDCTIDVNGYQFDLTTEMSITLDFSGDIELDEGVGTARWSIDISPVTAVLDLSVQDKKIHISAGGVTKPHVSTHAKNFLAKVTSIAFNVGKAVDGAISNGVQSRIQGQLDRDIFTVPVIPEQIGGYSFTITPTDLDIEIKDSGYIMVSGEINVS
jgi:hypothetical protein